MDLPAYTQPITLLEGNTPLIPLPRLSYELGVGFELFTKFKGLNPTGSFKDRGMTVAISEDAGRGVKAVICASTGNTAALAAAYAARAGIKAIVLISQSKVAAGKLAGAVAELAYFGAKVLHPKTIRPVVDAGIGLRICDTFNPNHPGTRLIADEAIRANGSIKAITAIRGQRLITIEGRGILG